MADPLVFTQESVKALRYARPDGQAQFWWDRKQVGLGVRLTARGARSYVLRYRVLGRQSLRTLGATSNHTLDNARIWARKGLSEADHDRDFQTEGDEQRAAAPLAQIWDRYVNEHLKVHGAPRTLADHQSLWDAHLKKPFGAKRLTEIAVQDVRAWHRRISQPQPRSVRTKTGKELSRIFGGNYAANRAVQMLRAVINWYMAEGALPAGYRNPAVGVELHHEKTRDVILRPAEMPNLAKAINGHPDKSAAALVWLAIFTGARRNELLKLKWESVDLKAGSVTFLATKNRTDRVVPLPREAIAVLKAQLRIEGNEYVFPGRFGHGHRVNVKDAWSEMRTAAGLAHLHLHDIRRSVGSWLGAAGYSTSMIGELLGHKSDITSKVYVKLGQLDVKRALVKEHAALVASAIKGKKRSRPKI